MRAIEDALAAGDARAAAAIVGQASAETIDRVDLPELRAMIVRIGDAIDDVPAALLAYARVLEMTIHFPERAELLDRLGRVAADRRDPALTRAVKVERARDLARDGEADEAIALAEEVIAGTGAAELVSRARAQAAIGRAYSFRRRPGDAVRAAEQLEAAAALLRQLDEPIGEAHTLVWLGYGALLPEGKDDHALAALRRAVEVAPPSSRVRQVAVSFLVGALLDAGRPEEAAPVLDELEAEAAERNDSRVLGYAAWNRAMLAALRNDSVALPALLAAVERHHADWFDLPTGAEFLAAASDMAQRLGNEPLAGAYLSRAEERASSHGYPDIALAARAGYEARFGDPAYGERLLAQAASDPEVARRERWRVQALRALAAARAGDEETARRWAAAAVEEAEAMGLGHLVAIMEPVFAERLLALAIAGGSAAARRIRRSMHLVPAVSVHLLGSFRVTVDGDDRTPSGQPATLVKLIALAGGEMPAEQVIETLWPEEELETGRRRLRNLLNRLHAVSGPLVYRVGEVIRLPGSVDLAAVEAELATLRAGGGGALGAAQRALERASGMLLPQDPYADWAVSRRERLHHDLARAADQLAADAEARGDIGASLSWLERAHELEPWELDRHSRLVRLARSSGDREHARFLARRAEAAYRELDLPIPHDIADALTD